MIDQEHFLVEIYSKLEDNHWDLRVFKNENDVIPLKSIDSELSLKEIYEEIDFKTS